MKKEKKKIAVFVESPNKIKKITHLLEDLKDGNEYTVLATYGNFRGIADEGKYNLGIDTTTFEEKYVIDKSKSDNIKKLKDAVKNADLVYLASDLDREGEAISWHCVQELKIPKTKIRRIRLAEITAKGLSDALANIENHLDENMVESARCRAELDKIIGYRLSPLSKTAVGALSAGRVQSAALKLLVDREKEIQAFIPEQYYNIELTYLVSGKKYTADYIGTDKKKIERLDKKADADKVLAECDAGTYSVLSIKSKDRIVNAKDGFTTSTVQQAASTILGFSPNKTTQLLQDLFTDSLITYIRTDSVFMSEEFVAEAKKHINKLGKGLFKGFTGKNSENAQEAHECIRPVNLNFPTDLDGEKLKLYNLIRARAISSLMNPATIEDTTIIIANGKHRFQSTFHKVKVPGFLQVWTYSDDKDDVIPALKEKDKVKDKGLEILEKSTNPPNRYSEAGVISLLEKSGIGRPSTYASTIETLKSRKYIDIKSKAAIPTELGIKLSDMLNLYFSDIINAEYTAQMELMLDEIYRGQKNRVNELKAFFEIFNPKVIEASKKIKESKPKPETTDLICPQCGKPLLKRKVMSTGKEFYGCSGFPKCRYTASIEDPNEVKIECPYCHKGYLIKKANKKKQIFYGCSEYKNGCKCILSEAEYKKLLKEDE